MLVGGNARSFKSWEEGVLRQRETWVIPDTVLDSLEEGWPKDNLFGIQNFSPKDIAGQTVFVMPSMISFSSRPVNPEDLSLKVYPLVDENPEVVCRLDIIISQGAAVYFISQDVIKKLLVISPPDFRDSLTGAGRPIVDVLKSTNWDAALESNFFSSIHRENIC